MISASLDSPLRTLSSSSGSGLLPSSRRWAPKVSASLTATSAVTPRAPPLTTTTSPDFNTSKLSFTGSISSGCSWIWTRSPSLIPTSSGPRSRHSSTMVSTMASAISTLADTSSALQETAENSCAAVLINPARPPAVGSHSIASEPRPNVPPRVVTPARKTLFSAASKPGPADLISVKACSRKVASACAGATTTKPPRTSGRASIPTA